MMPDEARLKALLVRCDSRVREADASIEESEDGLATWAQRYSDDVSRLTDAVRLLHDRVAELETL